MSLKYGKSIMGCLLAMMTMSMSSAAIAAAKLAIDDTRWVSVGAGMRTSFSSVEDGSPGGDDRSNDFSLDSMRLYVAGQAHEKVKFTFNTECIACGEADSKIFVLDAIVQFELNDAFNIWMGRMLTPADRIEMNGPYYGLTWNQYTTPLLPSDQNPFTALAGRYGRDDGVTVWGQVEKFQYAVGVFDGYNGASNGSDDMLISGRFAYNFLSDEGNPAYYTSSTYFGGAGDVFTVAGFFQSQSDGAGTGAEATDYSAYGIDVLFEKVLGDDGGVFTLEGEYKMFNVDLTSTMVADPSCFCLFDGDTYFVAAAFLLPGEIGVGKLQPYVRYTSNEPDDFFADSDLVEIGINYIISGHNARLNVNFTDGDANLTGVPGADVNAFTFGIQFQI